ncbi:hypothetical protein EYF80_018140 [Liparis tanakae]|uniref:Uncharacterized protein n=1 Tax=Liparis tanakae TaxID=230148 RepID=A0A4Z2I2C0_9TELE|nr:hypothetical protein EYF80_018140 [Liparis tanakae]
MYRVGDDDDDDDDEDEEDDDDGDGGEEEDGDEESGGRTRRVCSLRFAVPVKFRRPDARRASRFFAELNCTSIHHN